MEKRCKNCRHWQGESWFSGEKKLCLLTEKSATYEWSHYESLAQVSADYYGILATSPEFGCVQWEADPASHKIAIPPAASAE
jgi:hypothetical protein